MEEIVPKLNIEQCLSELIVNSLQNNANAIAVRFHFSEKRIQVIDNGCGMFENTLQKVGELDFIPHKPSIFPRSYIFQKIRFRADCLLIASKTVISPTTWVKIFERGAKSRIDEAIPRPCLGTTVSIKGLDLPFSESDKYMINNIVAIFALFFPTVSFSVRDDEAVEVYFRIGKPHRSEKIIDYICNEELKYSWYLEITTDPQISVKVHVGLMKNSYQVRKVYVNSKLATITEIEVLMQTVLQKCHDVWLRRDPAQNVFYVVYIECPITEFEFYTMKDMLSVRIKNRDLIRKLKSQLKQKVVGTFLNVPKTKCRQPEWRILNRGNQESKEKRKKITEFKTISPILRRRTSLQEKAKKSILYKIKIMKTPARNQKVYDWICKNEQMEVDEKQSETVVIEELDKRETVEVDKLDVDQMSQVSSSTHEVSRLPEVEYYCNNIEVQEQESENQENRGSTQISEVLRSPLAENHYEIDEVDEESENERNLQVAISQMSQWSDWSVELPTNVHKISINNVIYYYPQVEDPGKNSYGYSIIPQNLRDLMKYKNKTLVEHHFVFSQDEDRREIGFDKIFNKKHRLETRITERTGIISEFKLSRKSLEDIKIINQVNLEFIAAVTVEDNKKYLLLIDQHAVDERIRYEQLLEVYRVSGKRDEYISVLLETPITIADLKEKTYGVLNSTQELFKKYGVTYSLENTKVIVRSIPLCFKGRKYWNDEYKLLTYIRKLFAEVVESVINTKGAMILPSSIHLAIATEACRGAIKFGDPLNVNQCEYLMKTLTYTNGFSRCAHGRPSIIPLLDITSLNTGSRKQPKKLNYASLRRNAK